MRPNRNTLALLLLFVAGPANAAEWQEMSLPVSVSYGYGSAVSDIIQAELTVEPSLELSLTSRAALRMSARIRLDGQDELEPGRLQRDTYSGVSRPLTLGSSGTAELRDVYLQLDFANGLARFGKQQIVWGKLDGLKVLDALNPQSFREFIIDDFGSSRIGLWSAYLDVSLGHWRTELAWLPDATGHEIPGAGAWFELTAPRFRYGAQPTDPRLAVITDRGDGGAVGARLSRSLGSLAVSAVAYSGLDFEPLGRLSAAGGTPAIERFYQRRRLFGVSGETSFGSVVLRAEYAFQPDRVFNTRDAAGLGTAALDQHRGGVGLDISAPFDVFVNVQYLLDRVAAAPGSLVRPERDRIATLFLRRAFAYDRLDVTLRGYYSAEQRDRMVSAALDYELTDNTRVGLALHAFSGGAAGLFGQFAERDRITLSLQHTF